MFLHSLFLGIILYIFMVYGLGQKPHLAENRSILLGGLILVYMILFGHGLPVKLNKHLIS